MMRKLLCRKRIKGTLKEGKKYKKEKSDRRGEERKSGSEDRIIENFF